MTGPFVELTLEHNNSKVYLNVSCVEGVTVDSDGKCLIVSTAESGEWRVKESYCEVVSAINRMVNVAWRARVHTHSEGFTVAEKSGEGA